MQYKTQMEAARLGIITEQMRVLAEKDKMDADHLRSLVAEGKVAIPANINHHSLSAEGIGKGLRTKINVNLGVSGDCPDYTNEFEKVRLESLWGQNRSWISRTTERPISFAVN